RETQPVHLQSTSGPGSGDGHVVLVHHSRTSSCAGSGVRGPRMSGGVKLAGFTATSPELLLAVVPAITFASRPPRMILIGALRCPASSVFCAKSTIERRVRERAPICRALISVS